MLLLGSSFNLYLLGIFSIFPLLIFASAAIKCCFLLSLLIPLNVFSFVIIYSYFSNLLYKADLIIKHGCVGSIITAITKGKKVIAVPRLGKYNEHVNNHQVEFSTAVKQRYGNIIVVKNIKNLEKAILRYDKIVRTMTTELDNNNAKFNEKLETIVEDMFQ